MVGAAAGQPACRRTPAGGPKGWLGCGGCSALQELTCTRPVLQFICASAVLPTADYPPPTPPHPTTHTHHPPTHTPPVECRLADRRTLHGACGGYMPQTKAGLLHLTRCVFGVLWAGLQQPFVGAFHPSIKFLSMKIPPGHHGGSVRLAVRCRAAQLRCRTYAAPSAAGQEMATRLGQCRQASSPMVQSVLPN